METPSPAAVKPRRAELALTETPVPPKKRLFTSPGVVVGAVSGGGEYAYASSKKSKGGKPTIHVLAPASRLITTASYMDRSQSERRKAFFKIYGEKTTSANQPWLYFMCTGRDRSEYEPLAKVWAQKRVKLAHLELQRRVNAIAEKHEDSEEAAPQGYEQREELRRMLAEQEEEILALDEQLQGEAERERTLLTGGVSAAAGTASVAAPPQDWAGSEEEEEGSGGTPSETTTTTIVID